MTEIYTSERFMQVGENGFVTAGDVQFLRNDVYKDNVIKQTELNSLLSLAERAPEGAPEWYDFFGEVSADYYMREEISHDYITQRTFEDLQIQVTRYSKTVTPVVLSMLIKIMDRATATPPTMSTFVQDQIKNIIQERPGEPVINEGDVTNVRNLLFAIGGDGNVAVTKQEASLLFDLNDITLCSKNHASWSELFIKGITNHLMAHIGYVAPSREAALAQWNWVKDQDINVAGFFKKMISGGLSSLGKVYTAAPQDKTKTTNQSTFDQILAERQARAQVAEKITDDEAAWLTERLGRDGIYDDNERALISFMRELEAELPPVLQEFLTKAA